MHIDLFVVTSWQHRKRCFCAFCLIWFINQRAIYNYALYVVVVGVVGIIIGVCAHLRLPQGLT